MIKRWYWILGLGLGISLFFARLNAQCSSAPSASVLLAEADIPTLDALANRLATCPEQQDTLGMVLHSLSLQYYFSDDLAAAARYARQAVDVRAVLYRQKAHIDLGKSNANLSTFLREQGHYTAAILPAQEAIAIYTQLDIADRLARARLDLARTYQALGQYAQAEQLLLLAIEGLEAEEDKADAYLDMSNLQIAKTNYPAAVAYVEKGMLLLGQEDIGRLAKFMLNKAVALDELGQDAAAEQHYLQSIQLADSGDCAILPIAHNNLAQYYTEQRDYEKARYQLRQGAAISKQCENPVTIAQNYDHQGELLLSQGKYELAVDAFQQAQQQLLPIYQPSSPWSVPDSLSLLRVSKQTDMLLYMADQAKALTASPEPVWQRKALEVYGAADQLIAQIRQTPQQAVNQLFWRQKVLPLYERAIALCHRLGKAEEAFYFFEKSKAILLLEAMLENDVLRNIPDSLVQAERQLQDKINSLLEGQPGDETAAYAQYQQARAALQQLSNQLQSNYPQYASLRQPSTRLTTDDFIQKHLVDGQQVLVHYFFGRQRVFALLLSAERLATFDLGEAALIDAACQKLLTYFSEASAIENDPKGYAQIAHELYHLVIAPLNMAPNKRLLLLPDGPLTYLPFAALLTESVGSTNLANYPYLLLRNPLAYAHSAAVYAQQSSGDKASQKGMLAYAPFANGQAQTAYPPLTYSQDELAQMEQQFSMTSYRDEAATRANFLATSSQASILHLSTHAFASREAAEAPHIVFFDSLLYLPDLYQLSLPAELVVLSACQTNVGQLAAGEGVMGLGRGFVQAGAQSIIASLWNVNAKSSGYLLSRFYSAASQNTKPLALHQAQLHYLNDKAIPVEQKSPYYWAAFTYYGNDAPLSIRPSSFINWIWGGVATLAVLLLIFRFRPV